VNKLIDHTRRQVDSFIDSELLDAGKDRLLWRVVRGEHLRRGIRAVDTLDHHIGERATNVGANPDTTH
jgi:hypothetical protein